MDARFGTRRRNTTPSSSPVKPRFAVIAARQLCGACLQGLLRPAFADLEIPVYSNEADFVAAVGSGKKPDAVVFSSICPQAFDLEQLQRLIGARPDVPVAVHVDAPDASAVNRLIGLGVKGIIPTTSSPRVAVAALQLVAAGGTYVPPATEFRTRPARGGAVPRGVGVSARLTERQQAVLALAAEGKTNKEIARSLGLTQNTVKVHVARVMRRLGVTNRVGLARLAASVLGAQADRRA